MTSEMVPHATDMAQVLAGPEGNYPLPRPPRARPDPEIEPCRSPAIGTKNGAESEDPAPPSFWWAQLDLNQRPPGCRSARADQPRIAPKARGGLVCALYQRSSQGDPLVHPVVRLRMLSH